MGRRAVEFYNNTGGERSMPEFSFDQQTGTIIKYNFKDKHVKVPAMIKNFNMINDEVKVIGKDAFANNQTIESVTLDSNIKTIEAGAFRGCKSLKTVTINATNKIKIGLNAFNGCSSLTTVNIKEINSGLTIEANAFYGCSSLTNVNLSKYLYKSGTTIGDKVFEGTNLSVASREKLRELGYTGAGVGEASYKVTFMMPTGAPITKTAAKNTTVTFPNNPTKADAAFDGWNTKPDGSGAVFTASSKITDNITLYPKWKETTTT